MALGLLQLKKNHKFKEKIVGKNSVGAQAFNELSGGELFSNDVKYQPLRSHIEGVHGFIHLLYRGTYFRLI